MFVYGLHDGNPDAPRYVGVTTRSLDVRLQDHVKETRRADTHKRRWIQKAMAEGRKIGIVALDHAETEEELLWLEQFWIMALRALGARLTNASSGGDGLRNPTPETRAKMSAAQSKRTWSNERKLKHSQLLKGRPRPLGVDQAAWDEATPERRAKSAEGGKASRGHIVSDETRRLIGEANTGRIPSDEGRARMSQAQQRIWDAKTPEERHAHGLKVSGKTDEERCVRSKKMLEARYTGHVNRTPEEKRKIRNLAAKARRAQAQHTTTSAGTHHDTSRPVGHDAGATDITTRVSGQKRPDDGD